MVLGTLEIAIILGLIILKFAVIIGAVLYVKHRGEKKKQAFLEAEARRRQAQSASEVGNPDQNAKS